VAAYYYLRIIKVMFFDEAAAAPDKGIPFARQLVLLVSIVCVLGFIVKPGFVVEHSQRAAASLFGG
jgi:NADH-quinone oxidoreductase subunit N